MLSSVTFILKEIIKKLKAFAFNYLSGFKYSIRFSFSRKRIFIIPVIGFLILLCNFTYGEGSKELISNGGDRAYLRSSTANANSWPYGTMGTIKVYAKAGETLYLGSSAQGIGNGTIKIKAPDGNTYNSGNSSSVGRIKNRSEELIGPNLTSGGYNPYTITVGADQEGVWEINFISPDASQTPDGNNSANPPAMAAGDDWDTSDQPNTAFIIAFDVSVRNAANTAFILGRAFMNVFNGSLGSFSAKFNTKFKILTKDGYIYDVNNNGQAGNGFTFFVNNKGFRDGSDNATYQSYDGSSNFPVHDPTAADSGTDITHKIFFNSPSIDLPLEANTPDGSKTWLLTSPISPVVSNFKFTGKEGTPNSAGTSNVSGVNAMGGTISFDANLIGNYEINIDINQNGVFTDAVDRTLTGGAIAGTNDVYWDGLNGQNTKVTGSLNPSSIKITLLAGEVHFPFIDVENNVNGIIITRTNGVGAGDDKVYWDDLNVIGSGGPSNPKSTGNTPLSSSANGHKWGNSGYSQNNFGNNKGLDTWTYVISAPLAASTAIQFYEADLQVITLTRSNTALCVGQTQTYVATIKNNGPNNVWGAKFQFTHPAEFTAVNTSYTVSGTASVSGENTLASEYNSLVAINSGSSVTFTVTGTVSALPAGGLLDVQASILRPADVNEPDATNPDVTAPTDPVAECNSSPSGTGCNNILTNSTPVIQRNISIAGKTASEGTGGTNNMGFVVSLSQVNPNCDVTLDYTVSNVTTDASDFSGSLTGQVTIPAGQISATITIPVATDAVIEANETFTVSISNNSSGGVITTATATGTITNDDNGPVSISWVQDGAEPTTNPRLKISFPAGVTSSVNTTATYSISGTALSGKDYDSFSGSAEIVAGANEAVITITVKDDDIIEPTETVVLTLTGASSSLGASITSGSATVNIADNDYIPANSQILLTKISDGAEGGSNAQFKVSFPGSITTVLPTKINYTINGTAANGSDYGSISGTVTIPAGENSAVIDILVDDDLEIEATETVELKLTTITNALFAFTPDPDTEIATIADNDATSAKITLTKLADGTEGSANVVYRVSFPPGVKSSTATTVNYTIGGTALNETDYSKLNTFVVIPAHTNYLDFVITVVDDQVIEGDETVSLTLSSADNSIGTPFTIAPVGAVVATIADNDLTLPNNAITLTRVTDGAEPGTPVKFRIGFPIGVTSAANTVITYSNSGGTATSGFDYAALSGGTTIPAGENEVFIPVAVLDDSAIEPTETVKLTLTSAVNAIANPNFSSVAVSAEILDDDNIGANTVITLTKISDGAEGGSNVLFKVHYPTGFSSAEPTAISYTISGSAINGTDYGLLNGSVIIPAGQSSADITLPVTDDWIIEGDETAAIKLISATNSISTLTVNPTSEVSANIADNDNITPNNKVTLTLVNDGAEPGLKAQFKLSFPPQISSSVSTVISYSISGNAINKEDYAELSGTATIPPGSNNVFIDVDVLDDYIIEGPETVSLILTNATNSVADLDFGPSGAVTATIADDDNTAPNNIVTLTKVRDGIEGGVDAQFKVSFPTGFSSSSDTEVFYSISGTAINGTDYNTIDGSIIIPAGSNSANLDISVINDLIIEGDETVQITLTNAQNSVSSISVAPSTPVMAVIEDNDNTAPNNIITLSLIQHGAEPGIPARFKASFPPGITSAVASTVNYSISGTATNGIDYAQLNGSIVIPADSNSVYIDVTVTDDYTIESTETVSLTLINAINSLATLSVNPAPITANIADNDNIPANNIITLTKETDGAEPGTDAAFKVSFPAGINSSAATTINYTIAGTALNGTDYTIPGSITIPAGNNSSTIIIDVKDDYIIEGSETVTLTLTNATSDNSSFSLSTAPAGPVTATIEDDDNITPNNIITIEKLNDGAEPGTNAMFRVKFPFNITSSVDTKVAFGISGTALENKDYADLDNTVIIPAGSNYADIAVTVIDDHTIEGTETVVLNLMWAQNSVATITVDQSPATANIEDDDNVAPNNVVTITKVSDGSEPDSHGKFKVSFPFGYSSSSATQITYTVGGTATAGADYDTLPGTITILAGDNAAYINISVKDDYDIEGTEIVTITANPTVVNAVAAITVTPGTPVSADILDDESSSPHVIKLTKIADGAEPGINPKFKFSYPAGITSSNPTVINYTIGGTANQGIDYESIGSIEIPDGTNSVIIEVDVKDDYTIEPTETVTLQLTSASNGISPLIPEPSVPVVAFIEDDDSTSPNNLLTLEKVDDGKEPADNANFKISFPPNIVSTVPTTVYYTVGGTASAGNDYIALTPSIVIPANTNSIAIPVTVKNDDIIEGTETISLTLTRAESSIANPATYPATPVTANIEDDDNTAANNTISIAFVQHGAESGANAQFKVSFPPAIKTTVNTLVKYSISGTARNGTDYTNLGGSVIIPAHSNYIVIDIPVEDDFIIEGTENIVLTLTQASNSLHSALNLGTTVASADIIDNDNVGQVTLIKDQDGKESGADARFKVKMPAGKISSTETVVNYTISGGTADQGNDYQNLGGTVTIPAGATEVYINVPVIDDHVIEPTENVILRLTGVSGSISFDATAASADIEDNDVSLNNIISITRIQNGKEPASNAIFKVSYPANVTASKVTNVYYTVSGTATTDDYDPASLSGFITIPAGANSALIEVTVKDDNKIENTETITLTTSNATTNSIAPISRNPAAATANIEDDDAYLNNQVILELVNHGKEPNTAAKFRVHFPPGFESIAATDVYYTVSGTATPDDDYTRLSGKVTIAANSNEAFISVPVKDDFTIEGTETVALTLIRAVSSITSPAVKPGNAVIANIEDNDNTAANNSITLKWIKDGSEPGSNAQFKVSFPPSINSNSDTRIYYTIEGTATNGEDYNGISGNIVIPKGANSSFIDVKVLDDKIIEGTETVKLKLTSATNSLNSSLNIQSAAVSASIADNDNLLHNTITLEKINDGAEGGANARFAVKYPPGVTSSATTTISFNVAGSATEGRDYSAIGQTVKILPGHNSEYITINVTDDEILENTENVSLRLVSIQNAAGVINTTPVTLTADIADNDLSSISIISPDAVTEGNEGATSVIFNVKLNKATGTPFSVDFKTVDGSATLNDTDYISATGTLHFNGTAGEIKPVTIAVTGDKKIENDEHFFVSLSNLSATFGGRLAINNSRAQGNIIDDDNTSANKTITITKTDGSEDGTVASFTFSLPPGISADSPTIIPYVLSGTAISETDYSTINTGTLIIPPFQNSITLSLPIIDDTIIEDAETVTLTTGLVINNSYTGWVISNSPQSLNIADNDFGSIIIAPVAIVEGNTGTNTALFNVILNKATAAGFSIDYLSSNGTAKAEENDYTAETGTLNFNGTAGEVKTIAVTVKGDIEVESNEAFSMLLSNLSQNFSNRLSLPSSSVQGTITNDDFAPIASDDLNNRTDEDKPLNINILSNDSDVDGSINPESIVIINTTENGTIALNTDGTVTYTPAPDFHGQDQFTYTVKDDTGIGSNAAIVKISIIPVNDPPVANDDEFYMEQDTKLTGECGCSNDSDPDGDKLMFTKLTEPANGAASISTTGKLAYTPNAGYVGLDNFTYQACDASGACDIARITINVLPTTIVNLTPEFSNVTEGKKISVTASLVRPFPEDVTILLDYEGTASLKQDYLLRDQYQTIIIPKGSLSSTDKVTIHALTDAAKEGDETINITIATVSNERVKIGKEAKVNIQDGVLDSTAIEKPVPENPDIKPDPLVSPNDDGIKDFFYIENILSFNSNEVIIYNRQGNEVFRMKGYNETDRVFRGYANTGLLTNTNAPLVDGVYYYLIYTHRLIDGKEVTLLNKGYLIMKKQ